MDQKQNGTWYENPGGIVQSNEWYTPPELFHTLNTISAFLIQNTM